MKPENKFRVWFANRFSAQMALRYPSARIVLQKHADYATTGIPDMSISINGITGWYEVKLLTSCKEERKINVTPIQRAFLESRAKAGVPSGLLIGLALGPRKGYLVAVFTPPLSEVVHRDMFRSISEATDRLYSLAKLVSRLSTDRFNEPLDDFARLDVHADLGEGGTNND